MIKKFTLSIIAFLAISTVLMAQDNRRSSFRVNIPASLQGYKIIEESTTTGTSPWGRGIDSTWENFPVAFDPNNLDGCTPFSSPTYFAGKFALINRGDCEFGAKALNAQNAGARGVILVNNLLGVAGMGAGASGASVTIPVVMVTTADGNAMRSSIQASVPVEVSLTGWRFDPLLNPIDVGFMNDGPIMPAGRAMPKPQLNSTVNTDENFRLFAGSRFYNFSTQSWDTLFVKGSLFEKVGASFNILDSNTALYYYTTPNVTTDSVDFTMIDSIAGNLSGFDLNDFDLGTYKMKNEIYALPYSVSETPLSELNNIWETEFLVTDSVYSKAAYSNTTGVVANDYLSVLEDGGNETRWGPVLFVRNGGHSARRVSVRVMRDVITDSVFDGQEVSIAIYEWTDNDNNFAITDDGELNEVANGITTLTGADIIPIEGKVISVPMVNASGSPFRPKLNANTYYWVVAKLKGGTGKYAIGADYYADYSANLIAKSNFDLTSYGNTLFTQSNFYGGGYANAGSPSIALHMSKAVDPDGIIDISIEGDVNIFPNPATNVLNIDLELDNASKNVQFDVVDMTGKVIYSNTKSNFTKEVVKINTSTFANGTYLLKISTDKGVANAKFNVAK
jgi:hypothetical protein